MASSGVSTVWSEVTSTTRGPVACTAVTAAFAAASVPLSRPERKSSSNWLGVMRSAAGTAWSRMNSGTPGRTNTPRPTSPITGSQQYRAAGLAARTRPTAVRIAVPISAEPM